MRSTSPFRLLLVLAATAVLAVPSIRAVAADELRTVAESSGYKATSRHADVMAFCEKLAASSPRVALDSIGESVEGRALPLLVVADPPVRSAAEARRGGKLVVLLFGNIHAGEVCGKEALLMLARELGRAEGHALLRDLVVAIVPILNADGNERVSKDNRPGQVGPEEGMGQRENAQDFDLNRDWVKLEAPETRAVVRFMNEWDPVAVIDTHTTNGSYHGYGLTYAGPKHPAGDAKVLEFVRDRMLPEVAARLREESALETFLYGNFADDFTRWTTYPDVPRFGTPYRGLRNRIAILSEAYAYSTFEARVADTLAFVTECLEFLAENREAARALVRDADKRTRELGQVDTIGSADDVPLRTEARAFPEKRRAVGRRSAESELETFEVEVVDDFTPTLSVPRAFAYLLPPSLEGAVAKLREHGIEVEVLREDLDLELDSYRIDEVRRAEREFQKHRLVRVEATRRTESARVAAGELVVRTAQPLGTLATLLLEPQSADGFCAWNLLDEHLEVGADYPIRRVPLPRVLDLHTGPLVEASGERAPITYETAYESDAQPRLSGDPRSDLEWGFGFDILFKRIGDEWYQEWTAPGVESDAPMHLFGPRPRHAAHRLAKLPTIDEDTAQRLARRLRPSPEADLARSAFVEHAGDLYWVGEKDDAVRLTSSPEEEELPEFSPNAEWIAYVRDNDLWVVDVKTQTNRRLTTGGSDLLRSGKASWVYFEEVFQRNWRTFWWSPDSKRIAFLRIDSSPVETFAVVDDLPGTQRVEITPYPKPGGPNPRVELGIVSVAGGEVDWVDLSPYDAEDLLVTGVHWRRDSKTLLFWAQDRIQSWLDVCEAPARGGARKVLLRDTTEAWVMPPLEPHFFDDGSFLLSSERSGWRHLYHFERDGALRRAVTSGEWEVRRVHSVDHRTSHIYFSGTKDSHVAENLYRVELDGSNLERLTREPGSHRVELSPTRSYFIDTWSSHSQPTRVALRSIDRELVRTLDSNPVPDLERYVLCPRELLEIETEDGFALPASLLKPPGFDPSRRYPVWLMTYAGPHAPSVRDSWSYGELWDQTLAQSGIVVFKVDPRSASGRGAVSAWSAYRRLGVQELEDIEEAVAWLAKQPWCDTTRIGMSGYSYGGFMTAYAMTHTTLFAAGIAGGPVTDWRDYDTIYTERYMQTPGRNPEGYAATSVVDAAAKLHGRLLIVHGLIDDNVHVQNTTRLVRALQQADKQFELMLYPGARHGVGGAHYRRLQWEFIQRTVGPRGVE